MKTAIICYSHTHNNLVLAGEILTRTGGTLFVIKEKKARTKFTILFDLMFNRTPTIQPFPHLLERFDHYILISPIWGGKIASPLKSFIQNVGPRISSYSFITVCGGAPNQKEKIVAELATLLQKEPLMVTELSLSDYLGHPKGILDTQINEEQLKYFDNKIDDFLEEIGALRVLTSGRPG
jgi:hypothetical protein